MRHVLAFVLVLAVVAPAAASAQYGYGIRREPLPTPKRERVDTTPGYEGQYDRDYAAWKEQRDTCLYAAKRNKRIPDYCPDLQPAPPSPSDYVNPPPAN